MNVKSRTYKYKKQNLEIELTNLKILSINRA